MEERRQTNKKLENDFLFVAAAATDVVIAVALMKFDSSPDLIVKKYAFYASMWYMYLLLFLCVFVGVLLISDIIIIKLGFMGASRSEIVFKFHCIILCCGI